jgi:hypothetical protein
MREKIWETVSVLLFANMLITPFFFEGNETLKYDTLRETPTFIVLGWSAFALAIWILIGIIYSIWAKKK